MSGWNLPPGVSASDPHLTGQWPCECDRGQDDGDTCPVCEGKGYVDGEESYLANTYVCDSCGEQSVTYHGDTDDFQCDRRCDPDTHWSVEAIAHGRLS